MNKFLKHILFLSVILFNELIFPQSSRSYDKELRRLNAKIDRVRVLVDSLEFNERIVIPTLPM